MIEKSEPPLQSGVPPLEEIKFSPAAKRWTVILLVGLAVVFLLHVGEILPPFIWAAVTAFIFNGPLKALSARSNTPRWVWAVVIYAVFFLILVTSLLLIVPAIAHEARQLSTDSPNIQKTVDTYLNEHPTINLAGIEIQADTARSTINTVLDRLPTIAQELGPKLLSQTFRFLIDFLLYLITTFYLMLMGGRAIWRFVGTLPLQYRVEIGELLSRINIVLSAYIKGQLLLVLIMSVAAFITLSVLGVRYALTLGIMTGVLELIPFVGPYLAITICSLVAFFQPHGPGISFGMDGITLAIVVVISLFVLRQIEDYAVIPNLIGRIVELPPLVVIFTIVSGAALLGPMGLLLGVPIVAMLKIVIGYLYYKLVDAERVKVFLPAPPEASPEDLFKIIQGLEPKSRVMMIVAPGTTYLRDEELLKQIKEIAGKKHIDLAFFVGEDEKTAHSLREAGFPIVTMTQEHFLANASR